MPRSRCSRGPVTSRVSRWRGDSDLGWPCMRGTGRRQPMPQTQVVEHARQAGDARAQTRAAMNYAIASVYGSTPVTEAIARCEELAEQSTQRSDRPRHDQPPARPAVCHAGRVRARAAVVRRGARQARGAARSGSRARTTSIDTSASRRSPATTPQRRTELRADYDALTAIGEKYFVQTVGGHARALAPKPRVETKRPRRWR